MGLALPGQRERGSVGFFRVLCSSRPQFPLRVWNLSRNGSQDQSDYCAGVVCGQRAWVGSLVRVAWID